MAKIKCKGCGIEKSRGEVAFIPLLDGNGVRQETKPICWKCLIYRRTVIYKDGTRYEQ